MRAHDVVDGVGDDVETPIDLAGDLVTFEQLRAAEAVDMSDSSSADPDGFCIAYVI